MIAGKVMVSGCTASPPSPARTPKPTLQRRVQLFATTSSDKPLVARLLLLGRSALDNKKWGQKALQTGLVSVALAVSFVGGPRMACCLMSFCLPLVRWAMPSA